MLEFCRTCGARSAWEAPSWHIGTMCDRAQQSVGRCWAYGLNCMSVGGLSVGLGGGEFVVMRGRQATNLQVLSLNRGDWRRLQVRAAS